MHLNSSKIEFKENVKKTSESHKSYQNKNSFFMDLKKAYNRHRRNLSYYTILIRIVKYIFDLEFSSSSYLSCLNRRVSALLASSRHNQPAVCRLGTKYDSTIFLKFVCFHDNHVVLCDEIRIFCCVYHYNFT